jgi:hypothetical protein
MQRNVGGAERGPEVVALLAESVGRGPRGSVLGPVEK